MDANCQVVFDVGPAYSGRRLLVVDAFILQDGHWYVFLKDGHLCFLRKTVVGAFIL